jgi:hypothetical protein
MRRAILLAIALCLGIAALALPSAADATVGPRTICTATWLAYPSDPDLSTWRQSGRIWHGVDLLYVGNGTSDIPGLEQFTMQSTASRITWNGVTGEVRSHATILTSYHTGTITLKADLRARPPYSSLSGEFVTISGTRAFAHLHWHGEVTGSSGGAPPITLRFVGPCTGLSQ